MARPESRVQITDVRALSALAHPVRLALLNHLMAVGPQTASQCAPVVGATASNCSYHLRHLARFGLVEPAESLAAEDGRERRWQSTATGFRFDEALVNSGDHASLAAAQALTATQLAQHSQLAHDFLRRADSVEPEWLDATSFAGYSLLVNADELRNLMIELDRLIRPYIGLTRADAPADARPVRVSLDAFPTRDTE